MLAASAMIHAIDPWQQTLRWLSTRQADQASRSAPTTAGSGSEHYAASITVIDRPGPGTVVIAWRDATRGCYGDQEWSQAVARAAGLCAMSGRAIAPGDAIYKPRACRPKPRNAEAMILADMLHAAVEA
ncbi:protein of unknown function [Cupriavidus sp. YR651]|uniref:DUF3331 domain-containing protein n=1 Tax=Cupriavidus sp. YR651 TaxID=1855315 RepID=UPI0008866595|nr:DUF3331 domain-containing protein [Cupriavidus sp. YR651]SDC89389.1 protein of unknown function [Cupriavidus sp. YR651]